jgi:hypothetical protein
MIGEFFYHHKLKLIIDGLVKQVREGSDNHPVTVPPTPDPVKGEACDRTIIFFVLLVSLQGSLLQRRQGS